MSNIDFKISRVYYSFKELVSTNDFALQLLSQEKVREGTCIIAEHQTGGRGQYGRKWEGKAGKNLYMTVILKPSFLGLENAFLIHCLASVALCKCLENNIQLVPKIKWPNDLLVNKKKLAGILIQNVVKKNTIEHTVIGIGLNINQKSFGGIPNATSLTLITKHSYSPTILAEHLLGDIEKAYALMRYDQKGLMDLYNERLDRSFQYGITNQTGQYHIEHVLLTGQALMRTTDGVQKLRVALNQIKTK